MTTKTNNRARARSSGTANSGTNSIFSWGGQNSNALIGAAVAGAAVGLAANLGRKFVVQMASGATGDWADALATEHKLTLAIFDKIEATDDNQTVLRGHLLAKLKYALTKHALQEENAIYPALRQANEAEEADHLTADHGYVKTYLYELETLPKDSPEWLARVRDFRVMLEQHMREEENEIFPALRSKLSADQNARLGTLMHKEGFKFA